MVSNNLFENNREDLSIIHLFERPNPICFLSNIGYRSYPDESMKDLVCNVCDEVALNMKAHNLFKTRFFLEFNNDSGKNFFGAFL